METHTPAPGLYFGMSFEDYVSIKAVNNSVLKIITDQTPAHCKHYIDNGREDTASLFFGRAADCYILEPSLFNKKYTVGPDARRNSREWKDFESTVPEGVEILKPEEFGAILDLSVRVQESAALCLIQNGQSQVVCVWIDAKTGLLCKARFDYFQEQIPMITDMKTSRSAEPESFAKDIFKFCYYQQAAFYCDGWMAATGETYDPCYAFFVIEKEPPYVCSAFELGAKSLEAGRIAYRRALDIYAKCLQEDTWPAYFSSTKVTMIDMPNWALAAAGFGPEIML